ncbi:STY4199 family HEPN domain-containing protein [Kosakonia sp. BK9b]|uniref:STY4199 family HEPN domain-containing protein n=1 Tax=Kosakonia sp. TaxID=1916651 RepID=UPI0028A202D5|nr:STY4199 family HEPN domain-containing protein [Kosakonia sp.]
MTHTAPASTGEQFEKCIAVIREAAVEILLLLNAHFDEGKDPRWFLEQLDIARLSMGGWGAVAKRLKLNDAELTQFTLQLRHLQQLVPHYESGQSVTENQLIAALRFVAALENLRARQKLLSYTTLLKVTDAQQTHGLEQLRALELMIKSLVMQAWSDPERLRNHLKMQFGADRVRRWLRIGDRNDVLSGMRFSELALLLIDKKEFSQHYARLFNDSSVLNLFLEPRKTLQTFLDDIRQIRTTVIANQPLTSNQLSLLESYYPQITGPVQRAWEEGRTKTNPAHLLKEAGVGLDAFWEQARKRDRAAGGDEMPIRDNIDPPAKRAARSREERDVMLSGALWGAVGVMVLLMVIGAFWMFSSGSSVPASRGSGISVPIAEDRQRTSPKEELSNMGIPRDENNFRSAIDRNDTKVVSMFLRTGMNWKLSWTEQAMAADNSEVLEMLLRYRLQMDENRPCRRFITTLSHEMLAGKKLTSIGKEYLRAFCAREPVVERQRYEMEQAQLRYKAEPSDENKKQADIQTAIYNVID